MNRRIIDRELTEEQVREIEAACKLPYVEDEDCPQSIYSIALSRGLFFFITLCYNRIS